MNIVIVSFNKFPEGNAGAIREYNFGKIFKKLGHNVLFVGMGDSTFNKREIYKGFEYISLRLKGGGDVTKLKNYFGYASRLNKILEGYYKEACIDVIWVVDIPINALLYLKKYSKENNILLIHDSVEWYSPEQFSLSYFSPAYILKDLYNKFLIDKHFRVVAISRFLENHFNYRNIQTIRIPIIFDMEEIKPKKSSNSKKVTLLYAGSPGKKDYLKEMLEGLAMLSDLELSKVEFRILGVDFEQVQNLLDSENSNTFIRLRDSLNVLGKVSREEVLENLENADFTVMLRSSKQRYAKAGFPTKVVESLATGTPVILNITSDLGDYIEDMQNGLIVSDCSAHAFYKSIQKALKLSRVQVSKMKDGARKCAEENFDIVKYEDVVSRILKRN